MNKKDQIINKVTEVIYCYCEATASVMKVTETGYKSSAKSTETTDAVCRLKGMPLLSQWTFNAPVSQRSSSYDTIRDAILAWARKPTWFSLIYRTETTTKKCKTEKLKSKNG